MLVALQDKKALPVIRVERRTTKLFVRIRFYAATKESV